LRAKNPAGDAYAEPLDIIVETGDGKNSAFFARAGMKSPAAPAPLQRWDIALDIWVIRGTTS